MDPPKPPINENKDGKKQGSCDSSNDEPQNPSNPSQNPPQNHLNPSNPPLPPNPPPLRYENPDDYEQHPFFAKFKDQQQSTWDIWRPTRIEFAQLHQRNQYGCEPRDRFRSIFVDEPENPVTTFTTLPLPLFNTSDGDGFPPPSPQPPTFPNLWSFGGDGQAPPYPPPEPQPGPSRSRTLPFLLTSGGNQQILQPPYPYPQPEPQPGPSTSRSRLLPIILSSGRYGQAPPYPQPEPQPGPSRPSNPPIARFSQSQAQLHPIYEGSQEHLDYDPYAENDDEQQPGPSSGQNGYFTYRRF